MLASISSIPASNLTDPANHTNESIMISRCESSIIPKSMMIRRLPIITRVSTINHSPPRCSVVFCLFNFLALRLSLRTRCFGVTCYGLELEAKGFVKRCQNSPQFGMRGCVCLRNFQDAILRNSKRAPRRAHHVGCSTLGGGRRRGGTAAGCTAVVRSDNTDMRYRLVPPSFA